MKKKTFTFHVGADKEVEDYSDDFTIIPSTDIATQIKTINEKLEKALLERNKTDAESNLVALLVGEEALRKAVDSMVKLCLIKDCSKEIYLMLQRHKDIVPVLEIIREQSIEYKERLIQHHIAYSKIYKDTES